MVYENVLDGKYDLKVYRHPTDGYKGFLRLYEKEKLLMEEETFLSYGAKFGPDIADINKWQDRCCNFIDNELNKETLAND